MLKDTIPTKKQKFNILFQADINSSAKTFNSCLLGSCLAVLPADVCSSTVSLDETSYVNPMQLILCRYTRTLSQVCISASNVFRLYVRSPAPGQKPLSDLLCLTMGNDKAFSGKPQGRGSYPPHTGLSPWIVRYSFMEAVAVKDSCSHAYPALLLLVPPFRGLLIGRT